MSKKRFDFQTCFNFYEKLFISNILKLILGVFIKVIMLAPGFGARGTISRKFKYISIFSRKVVIFANIVEFN